MKKVLLEDGNYYHIYNRGNNGDAIFYNKENYLYFLRLYEKYINPIADTFAWVLLKNHFHFLIFVKEKEEINTDILSYSTVDKPKIVSATNQFSHLFNAYTQAINKKQKRTGSLFEKTFKRKLVSSDNYLKNLIYYIHNNPIKHGFVESMIEYSWASYKTILSDKPTKLQRKQIIDLFDDVTNFKYYHSRKQNLNNINDLLIE